MLAKSADILLIIRVIKFDVS